MKNIDAFGKTIKMIRESRRLTQKEISPPNSSRSNVSKIENNQQPVYFHTLLYYLNSLQVGLDEFLYISNNYQLFDHEKILEEFIDLFKMRKYENVENLHNKVKSFNESNEYDWYIMMMGEYLKVKIHYLHGQLSKSDYEENLADLANKTLIKINSFDDWFLYDLRMLNFIAYYLSDGDLKVITPQLFRKFAMYKDFPGVNELQAAYILNLSAACMYRGKRSLARQILNEKRKDVLRANNIYYQYIYKMRILILQNDHENISQLLDILNIMIEDKTLINQLNLEVFRNNPSYFLKNPERLDNIDDEHIETLGFEDIVWLLV